MNIFEQDYLNDLTLVGQNKLMGYHRQDILTEKYQVDLVELQKELEAKGVRVVLLSKEETARSVDGKAGLPWDTIFVYDQAKLDDYLQLLENRKILEQNNWPRDADSFVKRCACEHAKNPQLCALIALAYGDTRYRDYKQYEGGPAEAALPFRPDSVPTASGIPPGYHK